MLSEPDLTQFSGFRNLEVGIDTGVVLSRMARLRPREYFVGIELKPDRCEVARARLNKRGLRNASILEGDAREVLSENGDVSVRPIFDRVHIYFPTPDMTTLSSYLHSSANKLVDAEFLGLLHKRIRIGGEVRLTTDLMSYIEFVEEQVNFRHWWPRAWRPIDYGQARGELIGSPTERTYLSKGREIHSMILKKL